MRLNVACQMDPIGAIDITGDSTFALLLEAQRRGHSLFYYTPDQLTLDRGRLIATGHDLTVEDVIATYGRVDGNGHVVLDFTAHGDAVITFSGHGSFATLQDVLQVT